MAQSPPAGRFPHARRSPRFAFDALVGLIVRQSDTPEQFWCRSTDLSEGGIGVNLVGGDLKPDELVSLQIPLPKQLSAGLHATVRYRNALHCGFEFADLSEDERSAVSAACDTLARLHPPI